jgi:hypothetical protein
VPGRPIFLRGFGVADVNLRDFLLFEAAESGFKAELDRLREFYEAATAPNTVLEAGHPPSCHSWRSYGRLDLCDCGAAERQVRIDKAIAALAEAAEDGMTGDEDQ